MDLTRRKRLWVAVAAMSASGIMSTATLCCPDWIEFLTAIDPDHQDGSFERFIAAGFFVGAVLAANVARSEWRRYRLSAATECRSIGDR
jgi:hypothetical protein